MAREIKIHRPNLEAKVKLAGMLEACKARGISVELTHMRCLTNSHKWAYTGRLISEELGKNPLLSVAETGGLTECVVMRGLGIGIGEGIGRARCNPTDVYDRNVGAILALSRALDDLIKSYQKTIDEIYEIGVHLDGEV